ncbi:MAG: hypothetical protein RR185_04980 [Angelakisella sp.]
MMDEQNTSPLPMENPQPMPAPHKKPKPLLLSVIALAVVAVTTVTALGINAVVNNPQKVVLSAMDNASAATAAQSKQIAQDFPAAAKLAALQSSGMNGQFQLTLDDLLLPDNSQLVTNLLTGASLTGSISADPAAKVTQGTVAVSALQQKLVEFYFAADKNELQVAVPSLLPRTFGFRLDTLAEDLEKSVIGGGITLSDEEKAELLPQLDELTNLSPRDAAAMADELAAVTGAMKDQLRAALVQSGLKKLDKTPEGTRYGTVLTGEQAEALATEALDQLSKTQLAQQMELLCQSLGESAPALAANYQYLKETLQQVTYGDTTMIFTVKSRQLVGFALEGTVTTPDSDRVETLQVTTTLGEQERISIALTMADGTPGGIFMNIASSYQDKKREITVASSFHDAADVEQAKVDYTLSMDGSQPVATTQTSLSVSAGDSTYRTTLTLALSGSTTITGDSVTLDYPEISLRAHLPGTGELAVALAGRVDYTPLAAPLTLTPGEELLKMTEAELNRIRRDYLLALLEHPILGKLFGMLLS